MCWCFTEEVDPEKKGCQFGYKCSFCGFYNDLWPTQIEELLLPAKNDIYVDLITKNKLGNTLQSF